jgi:predicted nucleic acid-binding protein
VRLALDTNVMAYAEGVERAPEDAAKCALAQRFIVAASNESLVLARQALAELHFVFVRCGGRSPTDANTLIRRWAARGAVIDTNDGVFETALELAGDHRFRIFDALILAAAVEGACDLLLSEDLHDGFAWRGVVVTNPFGPAPDRRLAPLLA